MKRLKSMVMGSMILFPMVMMAEETPRLVETRAFYSTNAGDAVGKKASITIDGDFSDWTEDMRVSTCGANDIATAFHGSHENCVIDMYALYAAWDDANLYLAWQMCNTGDTWAREGDGPLTDGGRIGNVPIMVTLSVDPSSPAMHGKIQNAGSIWIDNKPSMGVQFASHVDHIIMLSGKVGANPGCSMFTAANANGDASYDAAYCKNINTLGIKYAMAEGFQPSHLWRQKTYAEWADAETLISDPSIINNIYDAENYDNLLATPYPEGLKPHDTQFDSFYEMNIPLSVLGIDREWLEANGIGVRIVGTRGESGIDCIPFDPSMVDNVFEKYGADTSTSHEKDDIDLITYELASVGKIRTGSVNPLPNPDPNPNPNPNPDPNPNPNPDPVEGAWNAYFKNSANWGSVYAYVWDTNEKGSDSKYLGAWPGKKIELDAESGFFKARVAIDNADGKNMKIIFNNGSGGSGNQTGDLDFKHNGIYDLSGYTGQYSSSIQSIETDENAPAIYYNLQGVQVANPTKGLYIVVRGKQITKEMVK